MKKFLLILTIVLLAMTTKAQVFITVNVSTAGGFSAALTTAGGNANTVTNLTVTGNINAQDIFFMRDNMPLLATLDLGGVTIKAYNTEPDNKIPTASFNNKTSLTSIILPNSTTVIGNNAFYGCSGLTGDLTIPSSVTSIGFYAFASCTGFKGSLTIPVSVTAIGVRAFMGCSGFTGSLTIPNSVTSIGESTFSGCSGFSGSLTIPNSATSIGDDAFYGCSKLTGNLTIPNSVTSIGTNAFYNCSKLTGSLIIPNSVTSIGNYTFSGCSGLTGSLTIPDAVTSIGSYAFSDCIGLTSLTINGPVTSIGSNAFSGCSGLTGSLIIPNTVTSIGDGAFASCNLGSLNINNSNYSTVDGVLFNNDKTILIQCPAGKTGPFTIPNSVTSIASNAFYGCSRLTGNLSIPNSVTSIGKQAFYGCSGFTGNLTISNSVTSIDDLTFYNCTGLTGNLTIPGSVTSIGLYAFANCSGFKGSLIIPGSVTFIKDRAFMGCFGFTGNLIIPGFVTSIGESTFSGCAGFTGSLTIPNSVTSIGIRAFNGCIGFTGTLSIPNSVNSIGDYAFSGCLFQKISANNVSPTPIGTNTFNAINKTTCELLVPTGSKTAYQIALYWKDFTNITEGVFVNFDSQGGSAISFLNPVSGTTITLPTPPTRTGYTFGGWYKEAGCLNSWNFATDVVTANLTLYAKWTINTYSVSFNTQGGSTIQALTVNYNATISVPAQPTRVGYTFVDWFTDAGYTNSWEFGYSQVTSDTTLYAKWTAVTGTQTSFTHGVKLYPNPACDYIILEAENMQQITVYDLSGKIILQVNPDMSKYVMSVNGLKPGSYLIHLKMKNSPTEVLNLFKK